MVQSTAMKDSRFGNLYGSDLVGKTLFGAIFTSTLVFLQYFLELLTEIDCAYTASRTLAFIPTRY